MREAPWVLIAISLSCGTPAPATDTDPLGPTTQSETDGDADDSSSGGEPRPNYAFITSRDFGRGFQDAGSATSFCRERAEQAGLPGTFVAWFPGVDKLAADRLRGARGWIRVDGKPFADTVDDILAGRIWYPLNVDERGDTKNTIAATGTLPHGGRAEACGVVEFLATLGESDSMGGSWTQSEVRSCESMAHFYCFGNDREFPVEAEVDDGRRAFVSSNALLGNAGIEAFDSECTGSARAAGLDGSFLAFVGLTTRAATDRFDNRSPWTNTRGQRLFESYEFFAEGSLETGIASFADGSSAGAAEVWSGANSPSAPSTTSDSCGDWSRDLGSASITRSGKTRGWFSVFDGSGDCSEPRHVYCFEE